MTFARLIGWKRRIRTAAMVVFILVGTPVGVHFYLRWSTERALRQAMAEADELDPAWQLLELEAKRENIPKAENSALKIINIKKAMPSRWPNSPRINLGPGRSVIEPDLELDLEEHIGHLPPEMQLSPEVIPVLQGVMQTMARSLKEARTLADLPQGRFPIEYTRNLQDLSTASSDSLLVARLLWADAMASAQEQRIDQALNSTLAILNTARSIGDEPIMGSQTQRMSMDRLAIRSIERVLAQGQGGAHALEEEQHHLEDEANEPLLLIAMRGERAATHHQFSGIFSGELRMRMRFYRGPLANKLPNRGNQYMDMVIMRRAYPDHLRLLTGLVEIAKLPLEDQSTRIQKLRNQAASLPIEFRSWFEMAAQFAELNRRNQARLRCAQAAMAVERFRLSYGKWPDSLNELVPEFLGQVPLDPFDDQPIRLRRLEKSVVVYSIGPDQTDDGGTINRENPFEKGTDMGFQLWDLAQRHQPWMAPPPVDAEEEKDR